MMFFRHWMIGIAASLTLGACGLQNVNEAGSELNYIAWSTSNIQRSTVADARKEWLHVCFEGRVSEQDLARAKTWARRAVLTWFRVIKTIDDAVTSNIRFTCSNPDLTIRLRNGSGTSFASPSVTTIYMTRPYGTWTHELGHALAALGDTYTGGSAGRCQSGQPQSLMCWGAYGPRANPDQFSTLWPDDIKGIKFTYGKLLKGDQVAPDWADEIDLEAPLNLDEPWPGASAEVVSYDSTLLVEIDRNLGPSTIAVEEDKNSIDL